MDFNDEGYLRYVFWVDVRLRVFCGYFGDVIFLDNIYLVNKYEIFLVVFVGINYYG